jgi:hypothetical protein
VWQWKIYFFEYLLSNVLLFVLCLWLLCLLVSLRVSVLIMEIAFSLMSQHVNTSELLLLLLLLLLGVLQVLSEAVRNSEVVWHL